MLNFEREDVGFEVCVITASGVRLEGLLSRVDFQNRLIMLHKARCYGTEGRRRRGRNIEGCAHLVKDTSLRFHEIKDYEVFLYLQVKAKVDNPDFPPLAPSHLHS